MDDDVNTEKYVERIFGDGCWVLVTEAEEDGIRAGQV